MKVMLKLARRATYADYLAAEQNSPRRHEFIDGVIVCMDHDGQATTNPTVIVEGLSPSTEGDDESDKRQDFQSLPTVQAYVLAAQDARRLSVYRRSERGTWCSEPEVYRNGDSFELPALTRGLTLDEVYEGVLDESGRSLLR